MPPEDADSQPDDGERARVVSWLGGELEKALSSERMKHLFAQFSFGNHVSHEKLSSGEIHDLPFSPPRLWRMNPNIYERTKQRIFKHHWMELARVRQPFAIEKKPGINDYSAGLFADSATLETLLRNARDIVEHQLTREVPEAFRAVIGAGEPGGQEIDAAVRLQFETLVYRSPTEDEPRRFRDYMRRAISEAGDVREGLTVCLKAIALTPEAVYRMELGLGSEDAHGRRRLSGTELAFAIAFALTDDPPDEVLWSAALGGGLDTPAGLEAQLVRVIDDDGREICASRELAEIETALVAHQREVSRSVSREDPDAWRRARAKWEMNEQTEWTFGDVPERVHVCDQPGVAVQAFPGLKNGPGGGVLLRLFKTPEEATESNASALARLIEWQLTYPLAGLHRDLKQLRELGALLATIATADTLREHAYEMVKDWVCAAERVPALSTSVFAAAVAKAKADLQGLVPRLVELLREILTLRQALLVHTQPYRGQGPDLERLVPKDFLRVTPYAQLAHFPRYLKGMKMRADRWKQNQLKDAERAKQLAAFAGVPELRWQVEELRVSLFAQELGTAEPVSVQKLERALTELRTGGKLPVGVAAAPETSAPKPREATPLPVTTTKPKTPIKSFGSLDAFFRK